MNSEHIPAARALRTQMLWCLRFQEIDSKEAFEPLGLESAYSNQDKVIPDGMVQG